MPQKQHWTLSQDCNKPSGLCRICLGTHQLHLNNGLLHLHGPRKNRCSNQLPLSSSSLAIISSSLPTGGSNLQSLTAVPGRASLPSAQPSTSATARPETNQPLLVTSHYINANKLEHPIKRGIIIKHIPTSARHHFASQLKMVLDNIVNNPNDQKAWFRLLNYGNTMLMAPNRGEET